MKLEELKLIAQKYAEVWLVNAIEKVKASLHTPDDIPSALEVAFTDGYMTGYTHAAKDFELNPATESKEK